MIEKQILFEEKMQDSMWRTGLRHYKTDPKYVAKPSQPKNTFISKINKLKIDEQARLEEKQSQQTYLFIDSIKSSPDIFSVYLDKTFRATEIVRTPKCDQIRQDRDRTLLGPDIQIHPSQQTVNSGAPWYNSSLKNDTINEQNEDDGLDESIDNFSQSKGSSNNQRKVLNLKKRLSSIMEEKVTREFTQQETLPLSQDFDFSMVKPHNVPQEKTKYGIRMKKKETEIKLEKTLSDFKNGYSSIVSPCQEEDLEYLYVQGKSKLDSEVECAKSINGTKFLRLDNVWNDEFKDKEEMIALNYDGKAFY
mmetsp:Transcript_43049/g.41401  ORF Transcript_43049/g.41401 Transcript_43049/m.41401 type:complete len:306 (-) Transcript_43049:3-920(-)